MTFQQFEYEVTHNRLREKMESTLYGYLHKTYGEKMEKYKRLVPDAVMAGLTVMSKRYPNFPNGAALYAGLETACDKILRATIRRERGRRKVLKTAWRVEVKNNSRKFDPTRHIDWKIDLERAIKAVVPAGPFQAACWHYAYEGYTLDEVADMLATNERPASTTRPELYRHIQRLNVEMKRKHYKGV